MERLDKKDYLLTFFCADVLSVQLMLNGFFRFDDSKSFLILIV